MQGGEDLGEGLPRGAVDAGQRLIEDQQLRVPNEGAGDEDALGLAPGEDLDVVAGAVRQPDGLQGRHRPRAGAPASVGEGAARVEQAGAHDFEGGRGHARCGSDPLGHVADSAPGHVGPAPDVVAEQVHAARVDRVESEDRPDQGRLARAVRAQERHRLASGHGQVDAGEDDGRAEHDRQVGHDDGRHRIGTRRTGGTEGGGPGSCCVRVPARRRPGPPGRGRALAPARGGGECGRHALLVIARRRVTGRPAPCAARRGSWTSCRRSRSPPERTRSD